MPCLLQNPKFVTLLQRIHHGLAAQARAGGLPVHRADYRRTPGSCPRERSDHSSHLGFCRSLGVSPALDVDAGAPRGQTGCTWRWWLSARAAAAARAAARLDLALGSGFAMPRRAMERWRDWWREQFPLIPLQRAPRRPLHAAGGDAATSRWTNSIRAIHSALERRHRFRSTFYRASVILKPRTSARRSRAMFSKRLSR